MYFLGEVPVCVLFSDIDEEAVVVPVLMVCWK